ncbi:hypothetical protein SprV_0301226500 [Sparganum proliferum]
MHTCSPLYSQSQAPHTPRLSPNELTKLALTDSHVTPINSHAHNLGGQTRAQAEFEVLLQALGYAFNCQIVRYGRKQGNDVKRQEAFISISRPRMWRSVCFRYPHNDLPILYWGIHFKHF